MNQLRPYQEKAVGWLVNQRRSILGSDCGTGKTAQLVRALCLSRPSTDPIIVICPANVKYNWEAEINMWSIRPACCQVIETKKDIFDKPVDPHYQFWIIIMSYGIAVDICQKRKIKPSVVVFDESHKLKNPTTKRAKALLGKFSPVHLAEKVYFLTGTPLPNNLIDGYVPMNFCLGGKLGKYWDFAYRYCYVKDTPYGKKIYGTRTDTLPELVELVRPILYRDKIEDVLPELPESQDTIVQLEHTEHSLEVCAALKSQEDQIAKDIEAGKTVKMTGDLSKYRRELGGEKLYQAMEYIDDLLESGAGPIVVFAHHTDLIAKLSMTPKQIKNSITGATPSKERQEICDKFQAGELDALFISIQAGGEGINLTRSRTAVFVEQDWSAASMHQARARLMRFGQKNFVNYYYLMFPNSIDQKIYGAVRRKNKDIQAFWDCMDGKTETVEELFPD